MATRVKTVEFPFVTRTTSLGAATRHDFSVITLDLPENSSRVFRSVYVEVVFCDHEPVGGVNLTSRLIGIKLGAVAFNDETLTNDVIDTYARKHFKLTRDITSYFTTNFGAGTSQTCQVGVQFGGVITQTISAKLIVTYEFSDTSQTTRVKTIKVPIQSNTGLLTNSLVELGTNSVPQLTSGGLLPENTVSIKHMWFEFYSTESATNSTDFNLAVSLDAEAEVSLGTLEMGLATSTEFFAIWVRNDMSSTATHALKARTTVTSRMTNLSAILCVTYTYDHDNTTTLLNSLELIISDLGCIIKYGGTTADAYRSETKFFIEEPGTITLKQSGVMFRGIYGESTTPIVLNMRAGGQGYTAYTFSPCPNAGDAGGFSITHRIDSGATAGAGVTLARGENTLNFDLYNSTNSVYAVQAASGLLILNYTSGLASAGAETHNHTTKWCIQQFIVATIFQVESAAFAPNIPETNYYVSNIGFYLIKGKEFDSSQQVMVEILSGEGPGQGWYHLYSTDDTVPEWNTTKYFINANSAFDRNPGEVDTERLSVEGSRNYNMQTHFHPFGGTGFFGLAMYLTYHCHTFSIAGTISGYTGDGSGITVDIHRVDNNEWVGRTTTAVGGGFNLTWYDDTVSMYAQALQDSTHRGRSNNDVAA